MSLYRLIASTGIILTLVACSDSDTAHPNSTNNDTSEELTVPVTPSPVYPLLDAAGDQVYTVNSKIFPLTFGYTLDGRELTNCTGDLPDGLVVAVSSYGYACEITGTPTTEQAATTHTITASHFEGSDTTTINITVRGDVNLRLTFTPTKIFEFSWNAILDVDHYYILENTNGLSGFSPISKITAGTEVYEHKVALYERANARYMLEACYSSDDSDCLSSNTVNAANSLLQRVGYFKASNAEAYDRFGSSVALSADGNTLAVGAYREDSSTRGINTTPDNTLPDSGAVYLFRSVNGYWSQQAYIKASNPGLDDGFGYSISLSADGNTLAVGAASEDSSTRGINPVADDLARNSGAVYLFQYSSDNWAQQAYIKSAYAKPGEIFGFSVSLSADGNNLVVGAPGESSSGRGMNTTPDNLATNSGAVFVFRHFNASWYQSAYIKSSNSDASDLFGLKVVLSADGDTLAVSAQGESSSSTGINSSADNLVKNSGAVYLYRYANGNAQWFEQAYIKASNTDADDRFGGSVTLSADGNTLAVGAVGEDSSTNSINSISDNLAFNSGAAYVYRFADDNWSQQAYIKAFNAGSGDIFGSSISLSSDGNKLAVGAYSENSSTSGINSWPDELSYSSGAAYVYQFNNSDWLHSSYIKANNIGRTDNFGYSIALSADGVTLAIGANYEASSTTGINSTPDDLAYESGAVYVY